MAKKSIFLLIVMTTMAFLSACTSTKYYSLQPSYNERYRNATKNDIYRSFGSPSRIANMSGGEYIIVYERYETNTTTNSYSNTNANANASNYSNGSWNYGNATGSSNNYSNSNTRTSDTRYYTEFYMNKNDRCYSVRTTDVYGKQEVDQGLTLYAVGAAVLVAATYLYLFVF